MYQTAPHLTNQGNNYAVFYRKGSISRKPDNQELYFSLTNLGIPLEQGESFCEMGCDSTSVWRCLVMVSHHAKKQYISF